MIENNGIWKKNAVKKLEKKKVYMHMSKYDTIKKKNWNYSAIDIKVISKFPKILFVPLINYKINISIFTEIKFDLNK